MMDVIFKIFSVEQDGLPDAEDLLTLGRTAFIWDGMIISGTVPEINETDPLDSTWIPNDTRLGKGFRGVHHWVLFEEGIWFYSAPAVDQEYIPNEVSEEAEAENEEEDELPDVAVFIKSLEGWRGDARLYRLTPPLTEELSSDEITVTEFVVVSAVELPSTGYDLRGCDTMVFAADEEGRVFNFNEIASVPENNHRAALEEIGYSILTDHAITAGELDEPVDQS